MGKIGIGERIWGSGFRKLEIEGSGKVDSKFEEVLLKRIIETRKKYKGMKGGEKM